MTAMADDISALSYEAALRELDEIIARLERGDVELEAAISAYERGAALTRHCTRLLDSTEQKITQLVVGAAGEVERTYQAALERGEPSAPPQPRAGTAEQRLFPSVAPPATSRGAPPPDPDDIPF